MTMTAALLYAMRYLHESWDAVAPLFPYAPYLFALWGIAPFAMDFIVTDRESHL